MYNRDQPPALPTYAEAMRAQPNVHHEMTNEYGTGSPPYNPPYPPMTHYPIPTAPNYSQSVPVTEYPPYQSYDQQQYHRNQQQQQQQHNVPPVNVQQPSAIRVIRHVSEPPNRQKSSHPKIIFAFILALIIIAAILRATIHHH